MFTPGLMSQLCARMPLTWPPAPTQPTFKYRTRNENIEIFAKYHHTAIDSRNSFAGRCPLLLPGKPGVLLDFYIYLMLRRLCNVDTQLLPRLVHVQVELLLSILFARRYESCELRILLN